MKKKGQTLIEGMVVFFIVFAIVGLLGWRVFGDARIGFIIGLVTGILVCGGYLLISVRR